MKLLQLRDELLEGLRTQFKAKVFSMELVNSPGVHRFPSDPSVDALLTDLANNLAQGLADVCSEEHECAECGRELRCTSPDTACYACENPHEEHLCSKCALRLEEPR